MIFSIPIKNRIIPSSMFKGRNDDTRRKNAIIAKIMIRIPSPICTFLRKLGCMLCTILPKALAFYNSKDLSVSSCGFTYSYTFAIFLTIEHGKISASDNVLLYLVSSAIDPSELIIHVLQSLFPMLLESHTLKALRERCSWY
jgi:hypothetical protein